MLCLQFAIGAANDLADSAADALVKSRKPIPAGRLSRRAAAIVFAVAVSVGLALAASCGVAVLAIGAIGLAIGLLYDLRLKGTAFGWVPFAAGVGLLPVYSWVGATGALPTAVLLVVALAVVAGCALALANAYSDLDDDRASGVSSIATLLGSRRTLALNAVLLMAVNIVACATTISIAPASGQIAAEVCGSVLAWLGVGLAGVTSEKWRHLVWETQGLGLVTLATGWLVAMDSAGLFRP